jgi:hypothetical protein
MIKCQLNFGLKYVYHNNYKPAKKYHAAIKDVCHNNYKPPKKYQATLALVNNRNFQPHIPVPFNINSHFTTCNLAKKGKSR